MYCVCFGTLFYSVLCHCDDLPELLFGFMCEFVYASGYNSDSSFKYIKLYITISDIADSLAWENMALTTTGATCNSTSASYLVGTLNIYIR